jgi:hypothetical protein
VKEAFKASFTFAFLLIAIQPSPPPDDEEIRVSIVKESDMSAAVFSNEVLELDSDFRWQL